MSFLFCAYFSYSAFSFLCSFVSFFHFHFIFFIYSLLLFFSMFVDLFSFFSEKGEGCGSTRDAFTPKSRALGASLLFDLRVGRNCFGSFSSLSWETCDGVQNSCWCHLADAPCSVNTALQPRSSLTSSPWSTLLGARLDLFLFALPTPSVSQACSFYFFSIICPPLLWLLTCSSLVLLEQECAPINSGTSTDILFPRCGLDENLASFALPSRYNLFVVRP